MAHFTIFGIMTMTKGVYDHGLTPNRFFCQRAIFLYKKFTNIFESLFSQDYKLLRLNTQVTPIVMSYLIITFKVYMRSDQSSNLSNFKIISGETPKKSLETSFENLKRTSGSLLRSLLRQIGLVFIKMCKMFKMIKMSQHDLT